MALNVTTHQLKCFHCGNETTDNPIRFENKHFCCEGCQAVYELLHTHQLQGFYTFAEKTRPSQKQIRRREEFDYLDFEALHNKLLDYEGDDLCKVTFNAPAIHCSSCIWLLEHLYKINRGVLRSEVNFIKKEIYIDYDPTVITLKELVYLLASIGYEPEMTLADLHKEKAKEKKDRGVWYKLGVAGFAFGNIMLFSLPSYFGLEADAGEKDFDMLFKLINLFLSLPVLLYSASEFLNSAYKALRHKHINLDVPLCLGILALFGTSLYEIFSNTGPGYLDSFTALIFFLLAGRALQRVFFDRMRFDKDHKSYFPLSVVRLDTQGECHVPLSELRAGDIILIRNKELIPADGVLVKGTALIDYSFVTGEAIPIFKQENETLYAGGRQVGGAIEIKVRKEPSKSYLTQLWNQHNTSKENEEDYESIVNKRSKYFTYGVLAVAISALVYWTYMDGFAKGVLVMATTLNVSCPCALAVAIPFTYANVVSQLAQRGFFLKNPQVIERITQVDTLVFDKTGTLTEPEQSTITYEGSTLDEPLLSMLKAGLRQSTHPLSVQLYRFIDALRLPPVQCEEVIGKGLRITAEGAYDIEIRLGSHEYVSGTNNTCTDLKTSVYIGVNSEVKGRYLFQNKYQQGLDRMLHSFTASGYRVDLASGDNEAELAEIQQLLPNAHILFNQKPEDKLHLIQDLQHKDHIVMMVGDGLNDAIALHQSNVGVAVVHAHNQFSPSSDVILSAPAVKYMDAYVRYCTECMGIIKASFIFSSMYNVIGLSFAIQGLFSPVFAAILMPVSSISVVLFSVFLTNWRASKTFKHLNESI